jgi:RNA polymerase sigma factor (sigma-70 family)
MILMLNPEKHYPEIKNVIFSLMAKYGVNNQNREDMLQSAYLGYLKALKTYNKKKSSLVTWCFYAIRKELQEFCKSYYLTSGFSNHRSKTMPKEKIVNIDSVELNELKINKTPCQEMIDAEFEEAIKKI